MDEAARNQRNADRLGECFPPFATVVRGVLDRLESQGFRPRIQEAWRSPEDQLKAVAAGHSKLKFGFHNVTGAGGAKEALACDILDDDSPLAPSTRYLLALAAAARAHAMETGILWGLAPQLVAGVEAALATGDLTAPVKVGWDPTHIQVTGITSAQAKAGARPTIGGAPSPPPPPPPNGAGRIHVVKAGETLSKIAKDHGTTLARILELNPELVPNPNLIRVGQEVRLG